ncbi:MAG: glutathione-disulfide reductase [Methylotenera sp.]|uniref:glutathione-disulfide reductase n=1 Tax=Methylotenera sp. TaxID=2051956 RepID=UPI0024896EC5|nr:glutathione-disulfide reductase [Methylotenera sp.]MDI1309581.1 glutathione-disulfide reductase [Methylotenera sp.]
MFKYDVDLFVIGAGSGGVRAARTAAGMGVRVAIAEEKYFGGTCVNVGCVPKKLFVYASQFSENFAAAKGYGWQLQASSFDWTTLLKSKNKEIERLQGVYERLLKESGVEIIEARAHLIDAHTVSVGGRTYTAERILIATGGWPYIPDVPGKEFIVTSNEMFFLKELPKRLLIVGGGYISAEFAGIMHGLGVEVTVCERNAKLLNGFDEDVRDFLVEEMTKKGINFRFNSIIQHIEKVQDGLIAHTDVGNYISTDLVMYATGRVPNTKGLGLEKIGVKLDPVGAVIVNSDYQTNIPSIYALGDVTNHVKLTPLATAEGSVLVNKLYADKSAIVDYDLIPTAVFSQPNIATVGLTEKQAKQKYGADIDIYIANFKPMKNTISGSSERTFMKMIVVKSTDCVVGIHMVGTDAGEIIQGMAIAMRAGVTKAIFDSTIGIHPTAAEEFVTMRKPVR